MSRPKNQLTDTTPIEEWEYDLIMAKLPEHWRLFYEILWQTGIRLQEGLAILKTDLEKEGVWIIRTKRSDHPREHLPLTLDLYNRLMSRTRYMRGTRVFQLSPSGAWLALKKACRSAGVRETIHPHSFRHSVGYRLSNANLGSKTLLAQAKIVQRSLGQKRLSSAERYFDPPQVRVTDALKKINEEVKISAPEKTTDILELVKKIQKEG